MLEAETNNEWTILDYLNDDCWCAVLQYVAVRDLIRTESTSRHWQKRLLQYLRGVRLTVIETSCKTPKRHSNDTRLNLQTQEYESFLIWTNKLGSSVVATDCYSLETLKIIRENCPKLESLFFHDLPDTPDSSGSGVFPYNLNKDFKSLKGLYFNNCCVTDNCINQFIADKALEDLELRNCQIVKGDFFNIVDLSSVKSLALEECYAP
ncbi:uncharacterized protein LOC134648274 [Cydia amplana]|uniref:uncharacterized protein LOC134648274 n=1 Tax=Cydia amplana TaxID=1869771 RepID=UPI002FE684D4